MTKKALKKLQKQLLPDFQFGIDIIAESRGECLFFSPLDFKINYGLSTMVRSLQSKTKNIIFILLFIAPIFIIYTVFFVFPLISGLKVVFYESKNAFLDQFVGFKNFRLLFKEEVFFSQLINAVKNNLHFLLISLIGVNIFALIFSFNFSIEKIKGNRFFLNTLFIPQILPIIAFGYVWSLFFNPSLGPYAKIIQLLKMPDVFSNLLGREQTALSVIACIEITRLLGFPLVIYYVAMNNISGDIIDAAHIDGASKTMLFFNIVIPMLSPVIIIANILMFIGSFIYFDLVYTMQGYLGSPSYSTDVLGVFFYRITFGGHHGGGSPGIGAVISLCMFVLMLVISLTGMFFYNKLNKRIK
ncbi:sugar ABC transporter permease [Treponema sp. HNW]|uniref:carbohydrate ABC transporter permease n=1 Tax=Treponema sp. HNW TaxID=3116654 RepID=UPI003D0C0682